jgi:hypothetical protein
MDASCRPRPSLPRPSSKPALRPPSRRSAGETPPASTRSVAPCAGGTPLKIEIHTCHLEFTFPKRYAVSDDQNIQVCFCGHAFDRSSCVCGSKHRRAETPTGSHSELRRQNAKGAVNRVNSACHPAEIMAGETKALEALEAIAPWRKSWGCRRSAPI